MTRKLLLAALALAGLAGQPAQAATWEMVAGSTLIDGHRVSDAIVVDDEGFGPAGASHADDPVNMGAWSFDAYGDTEVEGTSALGNYGYLITAQESYGDADYNGDGRTAALDNVALIDAWADFTADGKAGVHASVHTITGQSFRILPELGEADGDPVWLSLNAAFNRYTDADGATAHDFLVSLDLNGGNLFSYLPQSFEDSVNFGVGARIGDVVTLNIQSWVEAAVPQEGFLAGELPELLAVSAHTASMTLSPIPEPETWAMLLAGLGLVGLQLRRKASYSHQLGV
ncbi:MAG: PEPxxWA-CTERM sorting domain-containing protein [Thiobacillaceae bacterium]|jgi:hypothetical protein|nr:PEPxxWA-CTERM sorting domain-containing protein [Thiobacillaceae bacterium]